MKATINKRGEFIIKAKNEQEVFLLECWKKQRGWGMNDTEGSATVNIKTSY